MTSWQSDQLSKWPVGKMTSWQNDQLAKWPVGKMASWQKCPVDKMTVDKMTSWQNDQLTKWPFDKMTSWQNDQLTKWPFDKMTSWQNDQSTKCLSTTFAAFNLSILCHSFKPSRQALNKKRTKKQNPEKFFLKHFQFFFLSFRFTWSLTPTHHEPCITSKWTLAGRAWPARWWTGQRSPPWTPWSLARWGLACSQSYRIVIFFFASDTPDE